MYLILVHLVRCIFGPILGQSLRKMEGLNKTDGDVKFPTYKDLETNSLIY